MSDTVKAWIEERRVVIDGEVRWFTKLGDAHKALDALNAVLELHVKETGGTPTGDVADVCSCGMHYWPCPTAQAIEGAINERG